jgi:ribose transport system permease protein
LNVNEGLSIGTAIACGVAAGCAVGIVNGVLVAFLRLDPFIVTLGTGTVVQGVVFWISNSESISGVDPSLSEAVVRTKVFSIPIEFYYAVGLALLIWYFLEYTPAGRRLLFVGKNRDVARLNGLHVERLRLGAMIASATIASIAGVMFVGTTGSADPLSGQALLLPAYSAAFLGATAIRPGRYNAIGALVAVYFLVTGITGLQIMGAESFVQNLFYGGALMIAVAVSTLMRRRMAGA